MVDYIHSLDSSDHSRVRQLKRSRELYIRNIIDKIITDKEKGFEVYPLPKTFKKIGKMGEGMSGSVRVEQDSYCIGNYIGSKGIIDYIDDCNRYNVSSDNWSFGERFSDAFQQRRLLFWPEELFFMINEAEDRICDDLIKNDKWYPNKNDVIVNDNYSSFESNIFRIKVVHNILNKFGIDYKIDYKKI